MTNNNNNSCEAAKNYASIQQAYKKNPGEEKKPVSFTTPIQAVYDGKTGASLEAILAQFNSIYVQYQGSPQATRNIIPLVMRRAGLTITYMDMESNTITERANSAVQKDNDHWGLDVNWSRVDELSLSGEISVSASGTWIINGEDTGVKALGPKGDTGLTPWLKTIDNKLHFSYDNITWEPCSENIAAWFRFNATSSDSQGATIGRIQISRDNKTWTDLSPEFRNYLRIQGYVATTSALPSGQAVGTIYGVGPTYATDDTAHTNPIYRLHVWNGTSWVDNGQFTSIAAGVVQETGDSEAEVMSQKAVTEKLSELGSLHRWYSVNPLSYGIYYGALKSDGEFVRPSENYNLQHIQIPIEGVASIRIKSNSVGGARYALLKNNIKEEDGASVNPATGYTGTVFVDVDKWSDDIVVPSDAKVLYIRINSDTTGFVDTTPSELLFKNKNVEAKVSNPKWEHSGTSLYQSKYMRITYNEGRLMTGFIPNDMDIDVRIINDAYTIFRFLYYDGEKNYITHKDVGDLSNKIFKANTDSTNGAAFVRVMVSSDLTSASVEDAGVILHYKDNEFAQPDKEIEEVEVFLGGCKDVIEGDIASVWTDIIVSPSAYPNMRFVLPSGIYTRVYYGTYCNGNTDPSTTTNVDLQNCGGDYKMLSNIVKNGDELGLRGWDREEGLQFVIKFYSDNTNQFDAKYIKELIDKGFIKVFVSGYDDNELSEGIKRVMSLESSPQTIYGSRDLPMIVHISDIHSDSSRCEKAFEVASELKANAIINTGDNVTNGWECGQDWLIELEAKHRIYNGALNRRPFINVVGNHDGWNAPNSQSVFEKLTAPYKSYYSKDSEDTTIAEVCKGCYLSDIESLTDKTYYYSDIKVQDPRSRNSVIDGIVNQNLRIITLDVSEGVIETSERWYISKAQIDWFIQTLINTPKDTLVVVSLHISPDTLIPYSEASKNNVLLYGDDRFVGEDQRKSHYDNDEGNPSGLRGFYIQGNPITKIVDAFISHGAISDVYTQLTDSGIVETISYSANFANVSDGAEFVMYVNGHTHRDYVCYCQHSENVQLNACVTCTTGTIGNIKRTRGANSSDLIRGAGSVTQHAFNAYVIDRYHGRVGVARLGSDVSSNGTKRDVVWMSYKPSVKFSIDGINLNMVKKWRTHNGIKVYDACWSDFVARHSRTTTRYESDFILDYVKKSGRIIRVDGNNIAVYEYSDNDFNEKRVGYLYLNEARVEVEDAIFDSEYIVK